MVYFAKNSYISEVVVEMDTPSPSPVNRCISNKAAIMFFTLGKADRVRV